MTKSNMNLSGPVLKILNVIRGVAYFIYMTNKGNYANSHNGISSALGIFQRVMEKLLQGIPGDYW